jgi:hypothetical protein
MASRKPKPQPQPSMIDDRDVWQAALLIVKRYGDDALLEASERADQLLDEGYMGPAPRRGTGS